MGCLSSTFPTEAVWVTVCLLVSAQTHIELPFESLFSILQVLLVILCVKWPQPDAEVQLVFLSTRRLRCA